MTVWESGRESSLLDEIIAGRKTIEGRLNKGKFREYALGDTILLRRDFRDEKGELQDGYPRAAEVVVRAIRTYETFEKLINAEGYKKLLPSAVDADSAVAEYAKFYPQDEQEKYGVLAIEIELLC